MPGYKNLYLQNAENTLIITLDRPEKLNALNTRTLEELKDVIQNSYDDDKVKGIIITGSGEKAFVAGADIKELKNLNEVNARKFSESGQEVFALIEDCPKPVVALVNGYALGGGFELALACHIRIATKDAVLGLPEVTLGIIPGYGGTQRLSRLIGKGLAFELMMTGRKILPDEALKKGIVNYVADSKEEAELKCLDLLHTIYENAPLAISMVVNCINAAFSPEEDGYLMEANNFARCCTSEDFQEGTTAFLEKREPVFKGK